MKKNILMAAVFALVSGAINAATEDTRTQAGSLSQPTATDFCNYTRSYTYQTLADEAITATCPNGVPEFFTAIVEQIRNNTLSTLGGEEYQNFHNVLKAADKYNRQSHHQMLQPTGAPYYENNLFNTDLEMSLELLRRPAYAAKERGYGNIR